ncbi:MAG: bifunctional 5,10-methylenetetrahydrofolate dehydrogenase/5,10-methenyltetrahydrofolate cyclohydrolase [Firmicutes bacterium]|nr:bifunctional 5,10-methylenetetrahydrofolate dehydrogenase/5,10-methenyltetrahydrofolate cyclohydrolase [Bacillota bacterium]
MGQIIKGKPVADAITEELVKDVEALKAKGIAPKLKIVRVGAREDDLAYEKGALTRMKKCGIEVEVMELAADITQEEFVKELKGVNDDTSVHGILLFRPLPQQLDMNEIKYVISAEKDVDCISPLNVAKTFDGDKTGFPPCTAQAVMEILHYYKIPVLGSDVAVVGASLVVGKPLVSLLIQEEATVANCHIRTKDSSAYTKNADIVVSAAGCAKLVKGNWIKEGAVVIDVGINVDKDGNMCGDVAFDECVDKASMITPVPGGVGSVTTSVLAKHVVRACRQINNI